ncbi:hypothetical protein MNBD_NITROSPINAE01-1324 [hydrothermal vent metagenome]|uniref:Transcriptional repressor, BlaI/MecI family n=1 Tax=hydrothermal vent metagenome TaxID=652676 RepID=A0A3B1C7R1_9ZZZZ
MKLRGKSKAIQISRPLGELEMEVMKAIWNKGEATGKEVWQEIKETRKSALTTVLTVMDRLSQKGFLGKSKVDGLLVYTPAITREHYTKQVAGKMLKDYMDLSSSSLIASFVDTLDELDPLQLKNLALLIEKKKKEGRRQA